MKITITTVEEIEIKAEKLKQIGDIDVDDIFKNGKSTIIKTDILMDKTGDVNCTKDIEKKILKVLWK